MLAVKPAISAEGFDPSTRFAACCVVFGVAPSGPGGGRRRGNHTMLEVRAAAGRRSSRPARPLRRRRREREPWEACAGGGGRAGASQTTPSEHGGALPGVVGPTAQQLLRVACSSIRVGTSAEWRVQPAAPRSRRAWRAQRGTGGARREASPPNVDGRGVPSILHLDVQQEGKCTGSECMQGSRVPPQPPERRRRPRRARCRPLEAAGFLHSIDPHPSLTCVIPYQRSYDPHSFGVIGETAIHERLQGGQRVEKPAGEAAVLKPQPASRGAGRCGPRASHKASRCSALWPRPATGQVCQRIGLQPARGERWAQRSRPNHRQTLHRSCPAALLLLIGDRMSACNVGAIW